MLEIEYTTKKIIQTVLQKFAELEFTFVTHSLWAATASVAQIIQNVNHFYPRRRKRIQKKKNKFQLNFTFLLSNKFNEIVQLVA